MLQSHGQVFSGDSWQKRQAKRYIRKKCSKAARQELVLMIRDSIISVCEKSRNYRLAEQVQSSGFYLQEACHRISWSRFRSCEFLPEQMHPPAVELSESHISSIHAGAPLWHLALWGSCQATVSGCALGSRFPRLWYTRWGAKTIPDGLGLWEVPSGCGVPLKTARSKVPAGNSFGASLPWVLHLDLWKSCQVPEPPNTTCQCPISL